MKEIKLLSWNVNGIRAVVRKGFLDWLLRTSPDIICLQETKAAPDDLDDNIRNPARYHTCWNQPERKGYGGVATLSHEKPLNIQNHLGNTGFDAEGRVIITEYPGFKLFNIYFPNGKKNETRLKYKLDFYQEFFNFAEALRQKGEKLIICGDYNTAHKEIDLARPKQNEKVSGFLPVERAWLDKLVAHGYVDTFRHLYPEGGRYTWWDMKTGARERNVGWRLDYFFITGNLRDSLVDAYILPEVTGSDHCPVGITLKL